MARIIWTQRAITDLNEIAEYIAFDNPAAARKMASRVSSHVDQLEFHPFSGPVMPEKPRYDIRQIVEPPCRVFYRYDGETVLVLHVLRLERMLRISRLEDDDK